MSHFIPYFAGILSGVLLTLLWGNYLNWRDDRAAQRRGRFIEAVREPVDTFDRDAWEAQDVPHCSRTAIADAQERSDLERLMQQGHAEIDGERSHRANLEAGARR